MTATFNTSQQFLWDLARALHAGRSWEEIAHRLGHPPRTFRTFYRPRVRSYCLRLLPDPEGHGVWQRYHDGPCLPDGRRCEPCVAAWATYQRRHHNRAPVRTDRQFLGQIARRLVDGESWDSIGESLDRTGRAVAEQIRHLVQPYCLELVNAEQPSTTTRTHGDRTKYVVDRCRCEPCRWANLVHFRDRQLQRRRGITPFVDAAPSRAHLHILREAGVSGTRVATITGVSKATVVAITNGSRERIMPATETSILAVQPTLSNADDGALVAAEGTWACIAALRDRGVTDTWIADQIGQHAGSMQIGKDRVRVRTARRVHDLLAAVERGDVVPEGRRSRWAPDLPTPASAPVRIVRARPDERRLPVQPLLDALRLRPDEPAVLASFARVDPNTVRRWIDGDGIPEGAADRVCCAAGLHMTLVWPQDVAA